MKISKRQQRKAHRLELNPSSPTESRRVRRANKRLAAAQKFYEAASKLNTKGGEGAFTKGGAINHN